MIAYKLFKQRKDGSLGSLFINRTQRVEVGKWYDAEDHPTKGYAHRMGWHCTKKQTAPHLKKVLASGEKRVWCKIEFCPVAGWSEINRPKEQGGTWLICNSIKILEVLK